MTAYPKRGYVTIRQLNCRGRRCRSISICKEELQHLLDNQHNELPASYKLSSTLLLKTFHDGSVRLVKLTKRNQCFLQNCLRFSKDSWCVVKGKVITAFADDI